jgi:hypothetical protein
VKNGNNKYLAMATIGTELVGIIVVLVIAGRYLDATYHLGGIATAGGVVFGFAAWLVRIIFYLKRLK